MWIAQALTESRETRQLEIVAIEDRHTSLKELLQQIRQVSESSGIVPPWHVLEETVELGPSPWADPIPNWIDRLSEPSNSGISVRRTRESHDELAISWEEQGGQAWHHPTVVVIPVPKGAEQLSIEYEWERTQAVPNFYTPDKSTEAELLPALDARLYTGEQSSIFELDEPPDQVNFSREMLHDRQPRFRWFVGVKNTPGVLIGRIVRRFVRRRPILIEDPGFDSRLASEEAKDPETARTCPCIQDLAPLQSDSMLVVAVHGTFSCSMEAASYLRNACPSLRIARFEHDTFLPVPDNARELAQQLLRVCRGTKSRVLLVAHSRGGLVACQTAAHLRYYLQSPDVSVWTAGTPHCGTPLAGVSGLAPRLMSALYRLCARVGRGGVNATTTEGAVSYLVARGELPTGVACMRLGSDFLDLHRLHSELLNLRTMGGRCSPTGATRGHGVLLTPAVQEFFSREDNDLIVPTKSAILDGSPALEDCTHFQYFERCGLRELLRQHFHLP
jgi:hypothetical protein